MRLRRCLLIALVSCSLAAGAVAGDAWLDNDPAAIWGRAPGVYREGENWYAIVHVKPSVTRVRLTGDFTNWQERAVDLIRTPDRKFWWFKGTDESFARPPRAGDKYKFWISNAGSEDAWRQDPAARHVEDSNLESASLITIGEEYNWGDHAWRRPNWQHHAIYEMHTLRFTDRNVDAAGNKLPPFLQIAEELDGDGTNDYLNQLGVRTIELMPMHEFPGAISWGYNPSFFYAIESSYGTPDDFKKLVDTAHQNGIAVFLDVIVNHAGTGDNVLWQYAQDDLHHGTYYDGETPWGPLVNFDDDVARHYFAQCLRFLAKEYHLDGFRVDSTHLIHHEDDENIRQPGSSGGWQFLREIRKAAKSVDRKLLLIAEELPNDWHVTADVVVEKSNGDRHAPFDSQWCDWFHDHFRDVLRGGSLDQADKIFRNFGDGWEDGVLYVESHDEVGNHDGRIAKVARNGKGAEMAQLAATGTILARGIPMIFMGQEAGETRQFGHDDDQLRAENPGSGETWWDDRLPLGEYETDGPRKKVHDWYRRMLEIRSEDLETFASSPIELKYANDDAGIVAFTRAGGKYLVVLNFRQTERPKYNVSALGNYRELANTGWPEFNVGGADKPTRGKTLRNVRTVTIPAYGAVVLKRRN